MKTFIEVDADTGEVQQFLKSVLTAEEFNGLSVSSSIEDPFAPQKANDLPALQTVVEFVGISVAGGVTYDILKVVSKHLIKRFGADKIINRKTDDDTQ